MPSSSSSVGVTGVTGLSVRGLTEASRSEPEGSPWSLEGPAGGSMVMAEEVQHRSLRRRRVLVLKTVVSLRLGSLGGGVCVCDAHGAGWGGSMCRSVVLLCK